MLKLLMGLLILFVLTGCDKDHTIAGNATVFYADAPVDITIENNFKTSGANILTDRSDKNDTDSFDTGTSLETKDKNDTGNDDDNSSLTDVSRDIAIEANLSREPYYHQQWYLENNETFYSDNSIEPNASIHAGETLKRYTGRGVTIAIIDDGVDATHEELNGSIVAMYDIETNTTNVSHIRPGSYHGTAVTGIIAANLNGKGIVGIARESDIIFLKYKEGMSDSETIELFNQAEALGADIINCSWGTYDVSPAVKETIQKLAQDGRDGKGIIIVFAVGNNDRDMGNDESAIPEVIAVGSTDRDNLRAWYSNYGEHLDILAPGGYDVGITTLDPMGSSGIGYMAENYLLATDPYSFIGSSASAPIVTGTIALLLEKDPELTRVEIEELLNNRSDKVGTIDYSAGHNIYYGYGKVNAGRLLKE